MSSDLDLKSVGSQYQNGPLKKQDLSSDPIQMLNKWLERSLECNIRYANAATLSTISSEGYPSSRVILIKEIRDKKVIFFTNYGSDKALDMQKNPQVALNIYWKELDRQIRIKGTAQKTSEKESRDYFYSRPFESQVSAIASHQSKVVNESELSNLVSELKQKYKNKELPFPDYWGGFEISIDQIEFWQGRPDRLHDRFLFKKSANSTEVSKPDVWAAQRLAP